MAWWSRFDLTGPRFVAPSESLAGSSATAVVEWRMWQLGLEVTTVQRVKNPGRRRLAAVAGLVLLAAVRQVVAEEPGLAGIIFAALLVGGAAFLFTFVVRPESAFFLRDGAASHAGQPSEPEIIDLTQPSPVVEPTQPIDPPTRLRPNAVSDEATFGSIQDSGESTTTPEAM